MRALLAGALAAGATLAGFALGAAPEDPDAPPPLASEFVEVPLIVAPVFEGGTVHAYALARIGFEVEARVLHRAVVPPEATLADALHTLVATGGIEAGPNGPEPGPLRDALREAADEALGGGVVRAFVLRFDLLPKGEARGGSRHPAPSEPGR